MSTIALARPQSRRSFLAATAAGLAASGAAYTVQASPTEPDPVLALIEAEKRAEAAFGAAIDVVDRITTQLIEAGLYRRPRVQVGTFVTFVDQTGARIPEGARTEEPVFCHTADEVRRFYGVPCEDVTVTTGRRKVRSVQEAGPRLEDALAALDADREAIEAAKARLGLAEAEAAQDGASAAQEAAFDAVCAATPTTKAGLLAMLDLYEEREAALLADPTASHVAGILAAVRSIVREG